GEVEDLAGARDPDVHEAALLAEVDVGIENVRALRVERAPVRQQLLLHADEEDDGELEALGAVEGDERDLIAPASVGVIAVVAFWALERQAVQVGRERVERSGALALLEAAQRGEKALEVLEPSLRGERRRRRALQVVEDRGVLEERAHAVGERTGC